MDERKKTLDLCNLIIADSESIIQKRGITK